MRERGYGLRKPGYRDLASQLRSVQVADEENVPGAPANVVAEVVAEPDDVRAPTANAVDIADRDGILRVVGFDEVEVAVSVDAHAGLFAAFDPLRHFLRLRAGHGVAELDEPVSDLDDVILVGVDARELVDRFEENPGLVHTDRRNDAGAGRGLSLPKPAVDVAVAPSLAPDAAEKALDCRLLRQLTEVDRRKDGEGQNRGFRCLCSGFSVIGLRIHMRFSLNDVPRPDGRGRTLSPQWIQGCFCMLLYMQLYKVKGTRGRRNRFRDYTTKPPGHVSIGIEL